MRNEKSRSVSRLRSTVLLRNKSLGRNQRLVTVKEQRCWTPSDSSTDQTSNPSTTPDELSDPNLQVLNENKQEQQEQQPSEDQKNEEVASRDDSKDECVVDAVLAFQRWRQLKLKRSFTQELRKVLEEARKDEASLSVLQRELLKKEDNLSHALAETANLRARLSTIEAVVQSTYAEDIQKAMDRADSAEEEVLRRDKEITRLRQRMKCFEDEKARVDMNIQASLSLLQMEKNGLFQENRALLDQLSRKDQELHSQIEMVSKLEARIVSVTDHNIQMGKLYSENEALVGKLHSENEALQVSLRNQIKVEEETRMALERDVAVLNTQCDSLRKENENVNLQLEKAIERANAGEIMLTKLQYTSEGHAKSSEAIATGILEHLKNLTGHMMKLESSFGKMAKGPALARSLHKVDESLSMALQSFRGDGADDKPNLQLVELPTPKFSNQLVQTEYFDSSSSQSSCRELSLVTTESSCDLIDPEVFQWVIWKWRWVVAVTRSNFLKMQMKSSKKGRKGSPVKIRTSLDSSSSGDIARTMERELRFVIPGHSFVSILLAIWRAYRRTPASERRTFSKTVPLDKVLGMIPWWIRRVGEKRRLERSFQHWHCAACSTDKKKSEDFYFHSHSCYGRSSTDEAAKRRSSKRRSQVVAAAVSAPAEPSRPQESEVEKSLEVFKPEKKDLMLTPTSFVASTLTARALRTLQISLQQEFQDLQILLSKEMEAVQNQVAIGQFDDKGASHRKRTSFLWQVCNNLANSLMETHKQLVSLDREFNLRVCNYLELSSSGSLERPRSPAKSVTRQFEELRLSDDFSRGYSSQGFKHVRLPSEDSITTAHIRKTKSASGLQCNVTTTKKKPLYPKKQSCIASQCEAILHSEFVKSSAPDRKLRTR